MWSKSKLKPEKREDARVVAERGEVELVDVLLGEAGDEGENAVRSLRREVRG